MDGTDRRGDRTVIERIFRRMIRAAIESFPIDEEKKSRLLQKFLGGRSGDEVKNDELQ